MRQNGVVILTPIREGEAEPLRRLLAEQIEPGWDAACGKQKCRLEMPFDRLHMIHFACLAVIEEAAGPNPIAPLLLLEATVDGDTGDFLDDLIEQCGPGLDLVYSHCEGYPASGVALPHLVKGYLAGHNVTPQIHFQGHPGRTVAEIHGEDALRRRLIDYLEDVSERPADLPGSRKKLQRDLRDFVLTPARLGVADLRWATETRAEPFETRWGRSLAIGLGIVILLLIGVMGACLAGLDAAEFATCMRSAGGPGAGCANAFAGGLPGNAVAFLIALNFVVGGWLLSWIATPGVFFWTAAAGALWLAIVRVVQFELSARDLPGDAGVGWMLRQSALLAARLFRMMALTTLIALALLAIPDLERPGWIPYDDVGLVVAVILLFLCGAPAILLLRYIRTLPSLDSGFGHASARDRGLLSLGSDALWLFMAGLTWLMLLVVQWLFGLFPASPDHFLAEAVGWAAVGALSALLVLMILLGVGVLWLLSIYAREKLIDDHAYLSAEALSDNPVDSHRYAREGHGVNKVQNHLISVSRIKGGRLRLLRLRLVMFVVDQMCRWWFTRGELGDVRNIHFLRWLIIDKGRRLLFLDTYQGSWSGYLDAFIDSGSVRGLNAIWSHTFQHVEHDDGPVSFPRTECLVWKGARGERQFKEAVRASQKQTIVWYSAYPRTGGVDIINNSKIRNRLFRSLDTSELEALIGGIR